MPAQNRQAAQRAALAPLLPDATPGALADSLSQMAVLGEHALCQWLTAQGLAPLWHDRLSSADAPAPTGLVETLRAQRLTATANYLIQRASLEEARHALDAAGIRHVAIKGSDLRERLYDTPALRPAEDIDLLVAPADREAAIGVFRKLGYRPEASPRTISHELSLLRGATSIDLHWDLLRPGRTRHPLVPDLLEAREDHASHWGLRPDHALFLMLVHPVFVKHLSTPYAKLVRCVDLARWLRRYPDSADAVPGLLEREGLKTAAWMSCYRQQLLTGDQGLDELLYQLCPGPVRHRYLVRWLRDDWSTRLLHRPPWPQLGLTLPAHDAGRDALRALWLWLQRYRTQQQDMQRLARELNQARP